MLAVMQLEWWASLSNCHPGHMDLKVAKVLAAAPKGCLSPGAEHRGELAGHVASLSPPESLHHALPVMEGGLCIWVQGR